MSKYLCIEEYKKVKRESLEDLRDKIKELEELKEKPMSIDERYFEAVKNAHKLYGDKITNQSMIYINNYTIPDNVKFAQLCLMYRCSRSPIFDRYKMQCLEINERDLRNLIGSKIFEIQIYQSELLVQNISPKDINSCLK